MDKLTLEYLAPYLAWDLKIHCTIDKSTGILFSVSKHQYTCKGKFDLKNGTEKHEFINVDFSNCINLASPNNFKPLLRPLSDLTKEIEHKGEKFVPLIYLYNISNRHNYNKELNFEWVKSWGAGNILKVHHHTKGEYTEFIYYDLEFRKDVRYEKGSYRFGMNLPHAISCESKIENQYKLHQLLFEWHFDVFGLIPQNLAIDINTI